MVLVLPVGACGVGGTGSVAVCVHTYRCMCIRNKVGVDGVAAIV